MDELKDEIEEYKHKLKDMDRLKKQINQFSLLDIKLEQSKLEELVKENEDLKDRLFDLEAITSNENRYSMK